MNNTKKLPSGQMLHSNGNTITGSTANLMDKKYPVSIKLINNCFMMNVKWDFIYCLNYHFCLPH